MKQKMCLPGFVDLTPKEQTSLMVSSQVGSGSRNGTSLFTPLEANEKYKKPNLRS
jgi:hypothetical protein